MAYRQKRGTVEGTGSAINVSLGFAPDKVELYNYDDAGSAAPSIVWTADMADAAGFKNTTDTQAKITTNGVSAYAGAAASAGVGFTIGADTDVNASGETIMYIASAGD